MTMLKDVLGELAGMFIADLRLSLAVLALVGLTAALIELAGAPPLLGGGILLAGALLILVESVRRHGRGA